MQYARYEVGCHFDADGSPLIVVDGKILGTVEQVKATIESFESETGRKSTTIQIVTLEDVKDCIRQQLRQSRELVNNGLRA